MRSLFLIFFSFFFQILLAQNTDSSFYFSSAKYLQKYVQLESISGNEYKAGKYFYNLGKDLGLHAELLTDEESKINVAVSLFPLDEKKENIILLSHIDVVPEGELSNWKYPPYSGAIVNDTLWGRGALDDKGPGMMQLMALAKIKEKFNPKDAPYNVTVLAVSDEETGGKNGAAIIVDEYLEKLNPHTILGEGGSGISGVVQSDLEKKIFGIAVAEKSTLWLQLKINERSMGHGSTPPNKYASKSMLRALNRLMEKKDKIRFTNATKQMFKEAGAYENGARKFVMKRLHWKIFRPVVRNLINTEPLFKTMVTNTAVLTSISTPNGTPNQISNEIIATLDCRLLPGYNTKKFINELKLTLRNPRIDIEIIEEGINALPSEKNMIYEIMRESILSYYPNSGVVPILFPASSDNNFFREKNIPSYGIHPIYLEEELLETIHNSNERISLQAYYHSIDVYCDFLEKILKLQLATNE